MSLINAASLGLSAVPDFVGDAVADLTSAVGRVLGTNLGSQGTSTGPYSTLYAFGDSLSDAGNAYSVSLHTIPVSPPYSDGRFTNGPVWVQDLAASLNLPSVTPSLLGGTDFAYGDAETGATPLHAVTPIDLPSQLAQFALADPKPQANALYTLSIGGNDVRDALAAFVANPANSLTDIGDAVADETHFIAGLAADGARNLVVLNVPDLGQTPAVTSQGVAVSQLASSLSALYDQELSASLQPVASADQLNLHLVDAYSLLDAAVANPAAFSLTNVTDPLWTGNYTDAGSGTLRASGAAANGYLFFDTLHPTAQGHAVLAAAAQSSLA